MNRPRRIYFPKVAATILIGSGLLLHCAWAESSGTVSGVVINTAGRPVAKATVRVRASDNVTTTATDGRFELGSTSEGRTIEVTAMADGYYIASTRVTPPASGITLRLRPYHTADHPDYAWAPPIGGTSSGACDKCHPGIVSQWRTNAHGQAVSNPRFFSLYNGTDLSGRNPVGPGYKKDFPGTAGNCANCHAPGAAIDGHLTTDMNDVRDIVTAGIHCDYCHKIGGVYLNPATQSVYANAPGVLSQRMLRPPPGDNIFFGPYDDIKDPDTYLPIMAESVFCASCHQFSMWGTPIYESFKEWLESPYAKAGVHCQECHMPPNGDKYFAPPDAGGVEHRPERVPSHLDLGATSVELLQNTVTLAVTARQVLSKIEATVVITNTGAGHHVPTDHPGRHMILVVTATDQREQSLSLLSGSTVPSWGGAQAGLTGKAFAKLLRDVKSNESPVVSYWKQTLIAGDTRIPALGSDVSRYIFALPQTSGQVRITAKLIFRRLFSHLAEAKGWNVPDITMAETSAAMSTTPQ